MRGGKGGGGGGGGSSGGGMHVSAWGVSDTSCVWKIKGHLLGNLIFVGCGQEEET